MILGDVIVSWVCESEVIFFRFVEFIWGKFIDDRVGDNLFLFGNIFVFDYKILRFLWYEVVWLEFVVMFFNWEFVFGLDWEVCIFGFMFLKLDDFLILLL